MRYGGEDGTAVARPATTILHISDTQFGQHHLFGAGRLTSADQHYDSLFARLHEDLDGLRQQQGLSPGLVVVSGDLVESAKPSEFAQALEFLERLAAHLSLPRSRIVIVPGNHDVNRTACEAYFLRCEAEEKEPTPPYWPKWEPFEVLLRRFYESQPEIGFRVGEPWMLFDMPEQRLVVAALNSTIEESHRPDDHYGWVGEAQLRWFARRLREPARDGWLRIGVIHHNVLRGAQDDDENLRDADDVERFLAPHLDVLLHGHTHNSKVGRLGNGLPILSTGSAALTGNARPADVPNQYQVLIVEGGQIHRWARRYEPDQRRWVGDTRVSDDGSDWYSVVRLAVRPSPEPEQPPPSPRWREPPRPLDVPGPSPDDFLDRVAEICELRRPGARAARVRIDGALEYLRITEPIEAVAWQYPVGGCADGVSRAEVDRFVRDVHALYSQANPQVTSELVYGGERAPDDLVAYARRLGVRLVSFLEHQGVVDLRGYVERSLRRHAGDPRYPPDLYLSQRYSLLEGADESVQDDLLASVLRWMEHDQARFILVLGSFGTGKSFLTRELFRRITEGLPHLAPVLVPLGALQRAGSFDALIAQHLTDAGERVLNHSGFRYMLREGRIVLLLDGYDELASRVTYERATEHLQSVLEAFDGRAKMLLTSRTQHFQSDQQLLTALGGRIQQLPGRRIVRLQELDEGQIREFLVRRDGDQEEAERRFALIRDVRDLLGLAANPRMLSFIAQLEEERLVEVRERHGSISAAELYRLLLTQWLDHEQARLEPRGSGPTITREQRWAALTQLALELWQRGEASLALSELTAMVASAMDQLSAQRIDVDQIAHDVGSASLLVRDEKDRFGFVHQSVVEWLVAEHASRAIRAGRHPGPLSRGAMSALMADFVCDLAGREHAIAWARRETAQPTGPTGSANALRVLERLNEQVTPGQRLAERILRGVDLSSQDLRAADLRDADLDDALLSGGDLRAARLAGASLRGARLDGADLREADLTSADLTGARLLGADLREATLTDGVWRRAAMIGARLSEGALARVDTWGAAGPAADAIEPQTLPGGVGHALAIDAHGELLVTGGQDGGVRLWEAETGRLLRTLDGHQGGVWSVAISRRGDWLASAGQDGEVRLWDVETGRPLRSLRGHMGGVLSLAIGPGGAWLASAGDDGHVRVWDAPNGHLLRALEGHASRVWSVAISPDGDWLASAGDDGQVRIWDAVTGRPVRTLKGHGGSVLSVAISPDGTWLASAGSDRMVRTWAATTGRLLQAWSGHRRGSVWSVAIAPDGRRLVTAGEDDEDGEVRVWDADGGRQLRRLVGHRAGVVHVAIDGDGRWLVSAGEDGKARVWEAEGGALMRTLEDRRGGVWSTAISQDGDWLASGADDGRVRLWERASGRLLRTLDGHRGCAFCVAISPDGRWLASAGDDGKARMWERETGRLVHTLECGPGRVLSVAISRDGRWLATAGDSGEVSTWDVASGQRLLRLVDRRQFGAVWSVAIGPDGGWLASAGDDGQLRIWQADDGELLRTLSGHRGRVWSVAISGAGGWLAATGDQGEVGMWEANSGRLVRQWQAHEGSALSVSISRSGSWLASAGTDATVKIWDANSGRLLRTLAGHRGAVWSTAISPQGGWLASACADGALRLWRAQTDTAIATLLPLAEGWACLLPDGSYKLHGVPTGEFWYSAGLCRFEPGELDAYVPRLRRAGDDTLI